VNAPVTIGKFEDFDVAFGEVGAKVGPRTGANKRTQDEKEWYVQRRFLKIAIPARLFQTPLVIGSGTPPAPDFLVEDIRRRTLVEITEATDEADQREMTHQERFGKPILLGELGGRFKEGGGEPGHLWALDIAEAIRRKGGKSIFLTINSNRCLVIYPNSNASALISSKQDEGRTFSILLGVIDTKRNKLLRIANGCLVHILGKEYVFFDILGKATRRRRV
jgi:hypothetical protein